jgi:Rrf2 family protein
MAGVIQMSEAASIGIHTTLWLAQQPGELSRSSEICRRFGFSEAHFAKVMQALSRAGLVESVRGPRGGSRLARDPGAITLLEVFEALEGPLAADRCLLSPKVCPARCCPIGREMAALNRSLRKTLATATLKAMSAETDWSGFAGGAAAPAGGKPSQKNAKKTKKQ